MTVYVDPLVRWGRGPACFRSGSCHLEADSLDELHEFAKRLGMARAWFQDHPLAPHYDLTAKRRAVAVKLGALEQTRREAVLRRRAQREGPYVCPGCYAVGGEKCAPGCIDDEIERERMHAVESGDFDRFDDEDESEVSNG